MGEVPGGSGSATPEPLAIPLARPSPLVHEPPAVVASEAQQMSVGFGSHEPPPLTLLRRSILPCIVVVVLAACLVIGGEPLSQPFCALALIAFVLSASMLTPSPIGTSLSLGPRSGRASTRLLLEWFGVALILLFVSVAFRLTQTFSREVILTWLLGTPLALLLTNALAAPLARRISSAHSRGERYVIVGANEAGVELARRLDHGQFLGFLDFRGASRLAEGLVRPLAASGGARALSEYIRRHGITRVYLALPISKTPRIEELIQELRDTPASVYFVPNLFAFDLLQARCVDVNGMPVLSICDSPLHDVNAVWKRAFDLTVATIALLLGWPALLILAVAIKLSSPGPALFKQRRYGLNGEEILVYKFRSMTVCEDGPVVTQAEERDARVTPLGAFLRRTSFDELPQILNVLEGKMSLVGPRPHAVAHNEEYRKLISGYMVRHKVRPGITGWAQVHGLRGETRTLDKMLRRVEYDIDYIKNWSLRLDLKILAKTALLVLRDPNAY